MGTLRVQVPKDCKTWSLGKGSCHPVPLIPPRRRRTEMPALAKGESQRLHVSTIKYVRRPKSRHMGGCQNYGPFLGTLNTRCRIIIGIQEGTIILTTTHRSYSRYILYIHGRGSVLGNIFGILLNYQKDPTFGSTSDDNHEHRGPLALNTGPSISLNVWTTTLRSLHLKLASCPWKAWRTADEL